MTIDIEDLPLRREHVGSEGVAEDKETGIPIDGDYRTPRTGADEPIASAIASLREKEIIATGAGLKIVKPAAPEKRIRRGV